MYKTTASKHKHRNHDLYNDIEKIKSALADTAFDVKDAAGELISQSVDSAKAKTMEYRDNVADYTAEKPFKSLGIAFFAGIVLGYLWKK